MPDREDIPEPAQAVQSEDADREQASFDYDESSASRGFRREEEWRDEMARRKLQVVRWEFHVALWVTIAVVPLLLLAMATFAGHLFLPQFGWLTQEQQDRLTSWYSSIAQIAFPVLLLTNPWLIRVMWRKREQ